MLDNYLLKLDEKEVIVIKEYTKEYREKVINFLIGIAIGEFGLEQWREYFSGAKFLDMDKTKEKFWVAVDNSNNIIGTIGIRKDMIPGRAKMHSFYLNKNYRKKGIGRILYNFSLEFVEKTNYESIILHTYRVFSEAIKFYEKNEFKIADDIKNKEGIWYIKDIKKQEECI